MGLIENLAIKVGLNSYLSSYWLLFGLVISSLLILESSLRFTIIFSFVRVTQRSVTKYINDFINEMNTQYLDREHFVVKVQAGKLFQIAGWGTICVSFMTSFVLILQYVVYFVVIAMQSIILTVILNNTTIGTTVLTVIAIIQVIIILPSILYSAFLIILWLYFRYKTKVKYSGYSSDDPIVLKLIHEPETDVFSNQDKFHFTYYKHKNRVVITTYVVCVVLVSVTFAAFFTPVLSEKWKWDISLKPEDYHLLNNSVVKEGYPDDRFDFTFSQSYHLIYQTDLNCSENIFAGELLFNKTFNRTYKYTSDTYSNTVWIPENSAVGNYPYIVIQSQYPCYYVDPSVSQGMHYPVYQLGIDSCIGAKSIQDPYQQNFTTCTTQRGQLQCKILITGMYDIGNYSFTVQQFGYQIQAQTLIPLNKVTKHLNKYDVILFKSSENIINVNDAFCKIHGSCLFNPFFRILMPVLILLCSMIALTIGLILIHKI